MKKIMTIELEEEEIPENWKPIEGSYQPKIEMPTNEKSEFYFKITSEVKLKNGSVLLFFSNVDADSLTCYNFLVVKYKNGMGNGEITWADSLTKEFNCRCSILPSKKELNVMKDYLIKKLSE